jgi:hypothetical protein
MYDPEPAPKQRGCFFYGCIAAIILVVLAVAVASLTGYYLYRKFVDAVKPYTSESPMALPKVEMPDAQREAIRKRVNDFKEALAADEPVEPLVLTSEDINALISSNPNFKDHVHVKIDKDVIKGQVSLPIDTFLPMVPALRGRYVNGSAELKVALFNGVLVVTVDSLEVKGKPLPDDVMRGIRGHNFAENVRNPDNARAFAKIESIEVKDGELIIKPRGKHEGEQEQPKGDEEKKAAENPEAPKPEAEKNPDDARAPAPKAAA